MIKIKNLRLLFTSLISSLIFFGFTHYGPSYCKNADAAIDSIGTEIAKENGMTYIGEGMGSSIGANNTIWAAFYTCLKKLSLEEACLLAAKAQTTLSNEAYVNPAFKNYFAGMRKDKYHHISDELNDYSTATKIAFWDENVDRQMPPYLAEIRVYEGNIYCYYANPKTLALEDPIIKTFSYTKPK